MSAQQLDEEQRRKQHRAVFEPLILALEGKTIIYREKMIRLIRVSHVVTDEMGFHALATSLARIEAWCLDCVPLFDFDFGVCWEEVHFVGCCIAGYDMWTIYTDPELISQVTALLDSPERPNPEICKLLDDYMKGA